MRIMIQVVGAALALSVTFALPARAGESAKADPAARSKAIPANQESGMRAYVDPETGRLVSQPVTPQQARDAAEADANFQQDDSRTVHGIAADGSPMVTFNGQYELAVSASVDASGKLHTSCNDLTHAELGAHTDQPAAPAPDDH